MARLTLASLNKSARAAIKAGLARILKSITHDRLGGMSQQTDLFGDSAENQRYFVGFFCAAGRGSSGVEQSACVRLGVAPTDSR